MKSQCKVCEVNLSYSRGLCKKCYDVGYYWKKHKLPDNELHDFLRYRRDKLSSKEMKLRLDRNEAEEFTKSLPDINLNTTLVEDPPSNISDKSSLYHKTLKKVFDFLWNLY